MKIMDLKGLYIAHRGIQTKASIENTKEAFEMALFRNVPIEMDLQLLKDGNIVVFHDDNGKRLLGVDREISSFDYEELKSLGHSKGISILRFQEFLEMVSGKVLLIIEIKRTKLLSYSKYSKKILSILKGYPYDFVVKSFDIRIVYWFLHHTSYLSGLLIANRKGSFYDILVRNPFILSLLKPDFLSVDLSLLDQRVIIKYRKKKPVMVWTIRDLSTLESVKERADSYLIEKCYFV